MKGIREGKAKGRRKRKKLDASSSLSSFPPPSFTRPLSLAFPDSEFLASGFVMADRRRKTDNHYRGAARHLRARVRRPAHATGRRPNDVTPRECGTVMP